MLLGARGGWNVNQRQGGDSGNETAIGSIQLVDPAEETGSDHIGWTGSQQLSMSPELRAVWSSLESIGDSWMVSVS